MAANPDSSSAMAVQTTVSVCPVVRPKPPDATFEAALAFGFRRTCDAAGQRQRAHARKHVEADGEELRVAQSDGGHQGEVREKRAGRRAGGVGRVEPRDFPAGCRLDVRPHHVTNRAASACRP